jgi:DASS family divalent anion:Na+ symporter
MHDKPLIKERQLIAKIYKFLIPVLIGLIVFFIPKPLEIKPEGWTLLAVFIATIVGLITKPLPMGGVALIGLTASVLFGALDINSQALVGFSASISWLIVVVFIIARGFVQTKLGDRLAYFFVKLFGKTTLGLGYSLVLTEMFISPFMPSSIARAGGVIYPILRSLTKAVASSTKGYSERSIGAFLSMVCYQANIISSAVFLTAMAANPIIQSIASGYDIKITWTTWFLAASVPGLISVIVIPLFIYIVYPPKLKDISGVQEIAKQELVKMGPVSMNEWIMISVFSLMLFLWIFGDHWNIDTTLTSFIGLCLLLITNVLTVDDVISEKEAWHTLLWFAILMVLAKNLESYGVISWFSSVLSQNITHLSWEKGFITIVLVYFYMHYFFASITTHVSAMYAAFLSIAIAIGTPPMLAALVLAFSSSLQSCLTHYGSSSGPMYFAANFVSISSWWKLGFALSLVYFAIWGGIGSVWWKLLEIW